MKHLKGTAIPVTTVDLKTKVGTKVNYILKSDIDYSGRWSPRINAGTIAEIYRRHVDFGNGCLEPFSSIVELATYKAKN